MYGISVFTIVALLAPTIQGLQFPYFPWRTVLNEKSTSEEPQNSLCKLPPYPSRGGYVVVDEPDAKPGDLFQNVSLVEYKLDLSSTATEEIFIKAFHCEAGEWYRSIFRFQSEEVYFNSSWCPSLCALYEHSDEVAVPQRPKETYKTIGENRGPSKTCVLPPYPVGGGYFVEDQPRAKPGDVYEHSVSVSVYEPLRDGEIYRIKTIVCKYGKWFTKILNLESDMLQFSLNKLCPLICTTSFTVKSNASQEVSETTTKAAEEPESIKSCKLPPYPQYGNYTVVNRPDATPGEAVDSAHLDYSCHLNKNIVGTKSIFCVDGVWSDEMPKCISCGSAPSSPETGVSEEATLRRRLPWHASVFAKDRAPYEQICSGSIIATNLIITAARCFWNKRGLQPASRYAVAAGKVYRSWDDPRDGAAQKSDVNEIRVSSKFRGSMTAFKDDVAVLVLRVRLLYDHLVSPVCLDFDVGFDERQLTRGNYGEIASWGPTGAGADNESSTLRIGWMPYVGRDECISDASPDLREYITSDKICAGDGVAFGNTTSHHYDTSPGVRLCARDGGAGLVFQMPHEGLSHGNFYLRGIASVAVTSSDLCNAHTVNTFTHVLRHEAFLKESLRSALW